MNRLLEKALQALLTDPVTGEPVHPMDAINWTWIALLIVLAHFVLALGLGDGR